ncbi:MAG: hypothetical protein CMP23_06055 [Rickettsiales bacterium]|nr:hypothetical protein [Rickettsiales bacterium]
MLQTPSCSIRLLTALSAVALSGCGLGGSMGVPAGGFSGSSGAGDGDVFSSEGAGSGSGGAGDSGPSGGEPPRCAPVAELSCGGTVSGDTSDFNSGATEQLDSYSIVVGNYDGAEVAYSFVAPYEGAVSVQLVDAQPTVVDHDLFLLWGEGECTAEAALERGHNSLSFMAQAGERYYFVVDGFDGAEGAFEVALECGPDSSSSTASPDASVYGDCRFGWTSRLLRDAPHLLIAETGRFATVGSLSPLLGQQLLSGVQQDGWAPGVSTLEQVFDYVDPDGLYVNSVLDALTGEPFTWLKFYAGDTEVGYLYRSGTLDRVATVSDGDLINCTVAGFAVPGAGGAPLGPA